LKGDPNLVRIAFDLSATANDLGTELPLSGGMESKQRLRPIDWLGLLFFALAIAQGVPWFVVCRQAGEWGYVGNGAYWFVIPAAVCAILACLRLAKSLRLIRWISIVLGIGLTLATQGTGEIVGGIAAVASDRAPGFIGFLWMFTSFPLILIGTFVMRTCVRRGPSVK
jgi:hypothetical protein